MVEHAAIRIQLKIIREKNSDSIFELEDFVRNCHAKVEDIVVFPKLKVILGSKGEQLVKTLSRLEADHKLIEMIGEQIKTLTAQGEEQTMRKRIMLYADTLESHNSSEESLVFPLWNLDEKEERDIMLRSIEVIEKFGRERYFRITGISQRFFELISQGKEVLVP